MSHTDGTLECPQHGYMSVVPVSNKGGAVWYVLEIPAAHWTAVLAGTRSETCWHTAFMRLAIRFAKVITMSSGLANLGLFDWLAGPWGHGPMEEKVEL